MSGGLGLIESNLKQISNKEIKHTERWIILNMNLKSQKDQNIKYLKGTRQIWWRI